MSEHSYQSIISDLEKKAEETDDVKLEKSLMDTAKLLAAIEKKGVPVEDLESHLSTLKNHLALEDLKRVYIQRVYSQIVQLVQKKHGYVRPKHYQTQWMILGISLFGVPIGLIFSLVVLDNIAFMGLGFGFGMPIGIAIGMQMDKKAEAEGKVLDLA